MSGSLFATEPADGRGSIALPIVRQPKPALPTLIRPLPEKPVQFETLDALARHVHRLRGPLGLVIGPLQFASYGSSDTFPGFYLCALDPDTNAEGWIGFAAVQSRDDKALRDALRRTETRAAA